MKKIFLTVIFMFSIGTLFAGGWSHDARTAKFEEGRLGTISHELLKIHEGKMFNVSQIDLTLADDTTLYYLLDLTSSTITNSKFHVSFVGACGGDAQINLYHTPTVSSSGTRKTAFNFDQTSSNTSQMLVYDAPVVTSNGTLMHTKFLTSGTKVHASGGTETKGLEWILSPTKNYLIVLENEAGATKPASLDIDWYEGG